MSLSKKDQRFIRQWPLQEKKGRLRYVLTRGGLWGIGAAFASALFSLFDESFKEVYLSTEFLVRFVVFLTASMLLAVYMWRFNQTKYNQLIKERRT